MHQSTPGLRSIGPLAAALLAACQGKIVFWDPRARSQSSPRCQGWSVRLAISFATQPCFGRRIVSRAFGSQHRAARRAGQSNRLRLARMLFGLHCALANFLGSARDFPAKLPAVLASCSRGRQRFALLGGAFTKTWAGCDKLAPFWACFSGFSRTHWRSRASLRSAPMQEAEQNGGLRWQPFRAGRSNRRVMALGFTYQIKTPNSHEKGKR